MATWTKEGIQQLLDSNPKAVQRAIVAIYKRQTADEQASKTTRVHNSVGFSAIDAQLLTSFAEQIGRGRTLSEKQLTLGRAKIKRYWRQLMEIANGKNEETV